MEQPTIHPTIRPPVRRDVEHIIPHLTDDQRTNLATLAQFLPSIDPRYFRMAAYRGDAGDPIDNIYCGTSACAAGWGPSAGIRPLPEEERSWRRYCGRAFGATVDEHPGESLWRFIFAPNWPDDPIQASQRIAYVLDHGVPQEFSYDLTF